MSGTTGLTTLATMLLLAAAVACGGNQELGTGTGVGNEPTQAATRAAAPASTVEPDTGPAGTTEAATEPATEPAATTGFHSSLGVPTETNAKPASATSVPREPTKTTEEGGAGGVTEDPGPTQPSETSTRPRTPETTDKMNKTGATVEAATALALGERGPGEGLKHPDTGTGTGTMEAASATGTANRGGPYPRREGRHRGAQATSPRAGSTDDNAEWNRYLDYLGRFAYKDEVVPVRVRERYVVRVSYRGGEPAQGLTVRFEEDGETLQESQTRADGRTMFHHPERGSGEITVSVGNLSRTVKRNTEGRELTLVLERGSPDQDVELDVLFLVDATGSMSDEIERVKETLESIARRTREIEEDLDLRMGMVGYRDRGDQFVTRQYPFERNIREFARSVRGLEAEGGGDYPESLNEAMHVAVNHMRCREDALKLMFLIADAPPHLDYQQDHLYTTETDNANAMGIRIHTVASSGLDEAGEYIFRQMAQQTGGKFLFILYSDGHGGEGTPHDVGDNYTVERLDRLIVGLIREELEMLRWQMDTDGGGR